MLVYFLVAYLQTIDRLLILAILVGLLWFTWFNGLSFRIPPQKWYYKTLLRIYDLMEKMQQIFGFMLCQV